jgi:2-polyprenyl-3-methyl-5-hydroxy-6-metoxy-1,4-benzoquinol methylase
MSDLTSIDHWDDTWSSGIRMRLPSPWVMSTRNLQRLLRRHVRPHSRVLEIGCAPGKLLAWIAADLGADVSGLDFSGRGLAVAKALFQTLRIAVDLRQEDLRQTSFPESSFDVVLSVGVIEHFDDPRDIVAHHLRLLGPGGTALITVPNYGGLYGRLQRYFDPENLKIHNLSIMRPEALVALVPADGEYRARAYPAGALSPWQISLGKRWPKPVAAMVAHGANLAGLLQPIEVPMLCPILVLEVRREDSPTDATASPTRA